METDYSKEPVTIVDKLEETWSVGDKCKVNPFYLGIYCGMDKRIDSVAEVTKITVRQVKYMDLGKDDSRPMFAAKYGKKEVYDLIGLYIKYPNEVGTYLVSPFGYDKIV